MLTENGTCVHLSVCVFSITFYMCSLHMQWWIHDGFVCAHLSAPLTLIHHCPYVVGIFHPLFIEAIGIFPDTSHFPTLMPSTTICAMLTLNDLTYAPTWHLNKTFLFAWRTIYFRSIRFLCIKRCSVIWYSPVSVQTTNRRKSNFSSFERRVRVQYVWNEIF